MATRWAVATGNWSNPAIWNGGTLPTSSDDVFSNNFVVTIDQNITILSLRNTSTTGVSSGGGFSCSSSREIDCSSGGGIYGGSAATSTLTLATTGNYILVKGTVNGGGTSITTITISGTGNVNHVGNVLGGPSSSGGNAIAVSNSPIMTITGNLVGGSAGQNAVAWSGSGTLTVTGNVTGGNSNGGFGISNSGSSTITVTGNVTGGPSGTGSNQGISSSNGTVTINGTLIASAWPAIGGSGSFVVTGPFVSSSNGVFPFSGTGSVRILPVLNNYMSFRDTSLAEKQLYSGDTLGSPPSASNVRFGTTYAYGSLTGTLRMPTAQQVAFGVPVDATTGTAYFTVADFWNYLLSNGFTAGSIGDRLKNVATVDTTGSQLAAGN